MSRLEAILVCPDYMEPKWELPVNTGTKVQRFMVGWATVPAPVDAGVPTPVARLLAEVLVKHAVVSYPRSGRGFSFIHAVETDAVLRAFDDDYFNWSRRGQVLLLSPLDARAPALSERQLDLAHDPARLHRLGDDGFSGFVIPGVDGDVAGIYTFTTDLREALLASLEEACGKSGAQFRRVTEDQFGEELAQG